MFNPSDRATTEALARLHSFSSFPSALNNFFTGLSTLTWLLPDRFNDNELSLEAIHTSINLISALHDTMLNEPRPEAPAGASELTFALNALQQVQVLVELWGLYSEASGAIDSRYDPLLAVEGLKYVENQFYFIFLPTF